MSRSFLVTCYYKTGLFQPENTAVKMKLASRPAPESETEIAVMADADRFVYHDRSYYRGVRKQWRRHRYTAAAAVGDKQTRAFVPRAGCHFLSD